MAEHALSVRSCKLRVTSADECNGGLYKLPDEVLVTIMSNLTMNEAARTCTLSHRWRELWPYFAGVFNFEHSYSDRALVKKSASSLVNWVNRVVNRHRCPAIEGFKVIYDLDSRYRSHIDKWVVFALAKGAKSLVLELNPTCSVAHGLYYTLPLECCTPQRSPYNLNTLVLKFVNVTTEVLGHFLQYCPFLEKLCICRSTCLTSVSTGGSALALKHLEITCCFQLENIDILAPKLVTFNYGGPRIHLQIRNACLLSEVSIGVRDNVSLAYAFDGLSKYFLQLELLNLRLYMEMNSIVPPIANLANLKHLTLEIHAKSGQSLFGWVSLIEASPLLHMLTLQFQGANEYDGLWSYGRRRYGRPLKCLKTLELYGFVGRRIDLELATYVLQNAVALEEVLIDLKMYKFKSVINSDINFSKKRAVNLIKKVPPTVKRILIND